MKKAIFASLILGLGLTLVSASSADACCYHRHGWVGPAIIGGAIVGGAAIIATQPPAVVYAPPPVVYAPPPVYVAPEAPAYTPAGCRDVPVMNPAGVVESYRRTCP